MDRPGPAGRIACVSGSVAPAAAEQIAYGLAHGFEGIRLDAACAVDAAAWETELQRAGEAALRALGEGRDTLVFSATGPDDPAVARFRAALTASGATAGAANERLGAGMGQILKLLIERADLRRVVISGGDTSGCAAHAPSLVRQCRVPRQRRRRLPDPWRRYHPPHRIR